MRTLLLAAAMAATAIPLAATPADAQGRNERRELRECREDLRDADSRREYNRERRDCRRDLREARARDWRQYRRYDHNRPPPGGYYADDYYRDGRYYRERRLTRNDRLYRGRDGRYYCRRSDGTTGLIVGAGAGALLGNAIDGGRSSLLGTLIGAAAGGAIGREIERGNMRCR
ncbi:glycine zipper 2TM domain-containing protein [Sphingosinicella sp. LHD-64]|uniref:glycine zipper 2TM domain-containing protein n=1 Tax=Sphingosinicella sp. LHD-64 TaxID=3072139 RepID=UPI00280F0F9A|nr:glycine zipper 2TM domain-containing protein [Sphingosinicella sp. LHD-64]MDQ8756938.1 glycine zipper 2TM domain-containing protein [Sphingosinicella sp. LHD-64]